ncbi:unnamed protein product [Ectocarpus fasciculatus]
MDCQRDAFHLEEDVHYCNGGAYSPTPKAATAAGERAMLLQATPQNITSALHFEFPLQVRQKIARVINEPDADRIAIFPSVSYGMATVARNIHRIPDIETKKKILILDEEFPNDHYAFQRVAFEMNLALAVVPKPSGDFECAGSVWNRSILDAIDDETAMIVMPNIHWIYGITFDVKGISERCRSHGALLVIDGTQSVGMMPFDIGEVQADAVICAAYKWMLGPYAIGFGYFGPFFDEGLPVEETWMNRAESDNFPGLLKLQTGYRPKAQRFNMGEFSNFILLSMLEASVDLLSAWGIQNMYEYVGNIGESAVQELRSLGCKIVSEEYRAKHLFGVLLPPAVAARVPEFVDELKKKKIFVSIRGPAVRISLHVYNTADDLLCLVEVLRAMLASPS